MHVSVSVPVRALKQPCSNQWFDQEAVDGLVGRIHQRKRGQVDLLIPELEQAIVGAKRLGE